MVMKKAILAIVLVAAIAVLSGCQWATKTVGGSYTVELPADTKLVNVTWKDSNLWYLTRPMEEDDEAETYKFHEDSNFGVLEGTVTIIETKMDGGN